MAKSRSSPSAEIPSVPASKGNALAPVKGRPAPAEKRATNQSQRSLSAEEIGQVAGDLWHVLDTDGPQTLAAIKKAVDAPNDFVLAAIGWLAREDKLEFSGNSRSLKISLR
jgi:hypothetical protein